MLLNSNNNLPEIYISRQTVYDVDQEVFAYELLFQENPETAAINNADDSSSGEVSDQATSQAVLNVFMEIGLNHLFGDKLAFINLAHSFLTENHAIPFPKDKFILVIKDGGKITPELMEAIPVLRQQGYTIVVDDFVYDDSKLKLIENCNLIRFDFLSISQDGLKEMVSILKPYEVELLVKNVDSQEDFEICKNLGVHYFQGSFLCEPKVVRYKTLSTNAALLLQILAKTQDPEVNFDELEELFSQDVGISYKLLRLINSANFGLSKKVDSIHQAIMLLGMKEIKSWIAMVALSNIDSAPQELTNMSMARAMMCRRLAEKAGCENVDSYFTIGMFSLLDALMGRPMEKLLAGLPFSEEFNLALTAHKGPMGEALDCAIASEQGDWNQIKFDKLSSLEINEIYLGVLEWSRGVSQQLA